MSASKTTANMYVVSVGYMCDLLLPSDKALQLVKLLESSLVLEGSHHGSAAGPRWRAEGSPEVRMEKLRPGQLAAAPIAGRTNAAG